LRRESHRGVCLARAGANTFQEGVGSIAAICRTVTLTRDAGHDVRDPPVADKGRLLAAAPLVLAGRSV